MFISHPPTVAEATNPENKHCLAAPFLLSSILLGLQFSRLSVFVCICASSRIIHVHNVPERERRALGPLELEFQV